MFQPIHHHHDTTLREASEYTAPRFSTLILLNPPSPEFAAAAPVTPPAREALAEVDEEGGAPWNRDHCQFCHGCSSDACPRSPDARDQEIPCASCGVMFVLPCAAQRSSAGQLLCEECGEKTSREEEAGEVAKVLVAMRYGGRWFEQWRGEKEEGDNDDAVHGAGGRLLSPLSSSVSSPPPSSGGRGKKGTKRGKSTTPLSKKRKGEELDEASSKGSGSSTADVDSGSQSGTGRGEKKRAAASPLKRSIESDNTAPQPKKKKFRIIFKNRFPPATEAKKTDGCGDAALAPPPVPAPATASEESSPKDCSGHEEAKGVDLDKGETVTTQTSAATAEAPRTPSPAPKLPLRRSGRIIRINCRRAR
ncbi:hypothetical protein N3K66_005080 [Trichothecium roseum]|uniref:Uncharacterized protein n=1 Tax=Trichothecium roseum TaxID=47278 RepID=A0ACC0V308_9HYPO|nr:hypothetical protein N3K66_005080 [Trichothecium roseum]